jgi:hypothetical protein
LTTHVQSQRGIPEALALGEMGGRNENAPITHGRRRGRKSMSEQNSKIRLMGIPFERSWMKFSNIRTRSAKFLR